MGKTRLRVNQTNIFFCCQNQTESVAFLFRKYACNIVTIVFTSDLVLFLLPLLITSDLTEAINNFSLFLGRFSDKITRNLFLNQKK